MTSPHVPLSVPVVMGDMEVREAKLGIGAPFELSVDTVAVGAASAEDVHAVSEIWVVGAGSGTLVYDGVTSRLQAGDVVYFEPHKPHQVLNDGEERLLLFSMWWS